MDTAKREMAKEKTYSNFFVGHRENNLYRLARQRDCARKDVQYIGVINNQDTNISEESLLRNRKECFGKLMNEEN